MFYRIKFIFIIYKRSIIETRHICLHYKTCEYLKKIKKEAEIDGEHHIARRIHAILLNASGYSSTKIGKLLFCSRSSASKWLKDYEYFGLDGLLEGLKSGRPQGLNDKQKMLLGDIIDSGPVAYGFLGGVWSGKMVLNVIQNEFSLKYTEQHTRKILRYIGFSIQCPKRNLIYSDPVKKEKWRKYTFPYLKKKQQSKVV